MNKPDQAPAAKCDAQDLAFNWHAAAHALGAAPATQLRQQFDEARRRMDPADVEGGFRAFAAGLLQHGLIPMSDYVAVFGGQALHCLSWDQGRFVAMDTVADASALVRRYSRAKHGSIEDIRYLAALVIRALSAAIDDPHNPWRRLFETAGQRGESVAMMTTGWRNVPSTANVLYALVVQHINVKLAGLGLPTIVEVKLPRIAPPCEDYASLSTEERQRISLTQDHVIPASNLYRWSAVHVIFGDDVLVTGSTADKVFAHSMRSGARSFRAIYPLALDPGVALLDPAVEERLNTVEVTGAFDERVAAFLSHPDNVPILRSLRLVFGAQNRAQLKLHLERIPSRNWLALYVSALNNEFLRQPACRESLDLLRQHLTREQLLDSDGTPQLRWLQQGPRP